MSHLFFFLCFSHLYPLLHVVSVGYEYESCASLILWEKRTAVLQGYELDPTSLGGWSLDKHHILNTRSGTYTHNTHTHLYINAFVLTNEHRLFQLFPLFSFYFIFSQAPMCSRFAVRYISLNSLLSWGGCRPRKVSCGSHGFARRLVLPVSADFHRKSLCCLT